MSSYRILILKRICKCAIFFFSLSLQRKHGSGYGRKAHLTNVPDSYTESIEGFRSVKIRHSAEIVIVKIFGWINAAAHQKHITDAVLQYLPVFHLDIQVVQFL